MRRLIAVGVVAVIAATQSGGNVAHATRCWEPPVEAPVSDPYRPPGCLWCAGNRGIEFNTSPGEPVRAVAAGVVSFAGVVAGTGYLVVRHADGRRATYGNIATVTLNADDPVVAGMVVGTTAGRFHFGLRDDDGYIDPTPLLGRWVARARLVPVDGSPARPAPPRQLVCDSVPSMVRRR